MGSALDIVFPLLVLAGLFGGSHSLSKRFPKFFGVVSSPEPSKFGSFIGDAVDTTLKITYCDFHGVQTQRVVKFSQYDLLHHVATGHCSLRNAERHFRVDRILTAVDISTGEIVTDLRSYFHEHHPKTITRKKILADWATDPKRWPSAAAAGRHYAALPENKDYSAENITRWIRQFGKQTGAAATIRR